MVAATLATQEMPADECVRKAYQIIEIAALGKAYLTDEPNVDFPKSSRLDEFFHHIFHRWDDFDPTPSPFEHLLKVDEDLTPLPIPFDKGIKIIIPKPGKNSNRQPLIHQWLMDKHKISANEASEKIAQWVRDGIPYDDAHIAFYSYPKWRVWRTSKVRREARAKRKRQARPQETSQADKIILGVLGEMAEQRKKPY
jgi:hypothetical protein